MDAKLIERLKTEVIGPLVVSPATIFRWYRGEMIITCVDSGKATSTNDFRLLQMLNAFASPRRPREVLRELSSMSQAFLFSSIAGLINAGVLVEARESFETDAAEKPPIETRSQDIQATPETRALAEAANRIAQDYTKNISELARAVNGDLWGFGAYVHQEMNSSLQSRLVARLGKIKGELSEIADELRQQRVPYLETQLSRFDLLQGGLKLNLGSGRSHIDGWINVDVPPADVEMHLSWGLPFSDEAVRCCYLSHVLEHFYRQEAVELLREAYRVLQGGGVARIVVPDIEKCMQAYVRHDQGYFETRRKLWSVSSKSAATPLEMVLKNAGAAVKPGSLWGHKHGYDFETLSQVLQEAGFTYIERSDYMTSAYEDLRLDDVSRVAGNEHAEMKFSMFVEARK